MKSISFQWTPGIESWEAETVVSTIAHLQEVALVLGQRAGFSVERGHLRPFGTWVIPQLPRGSPYWSALWYVEQSLDEASGQIVGPRFIRTLEREPWQQAGPHYDVAILDHDLRDAPEHNISPRSDPHVFASCRPNLAAVLSVHRLRAISETSQRQTALRRLAINAFGRVLELPGASRQTNVEMARGKPGLPQPLRVALRSRRGTAAGLREGRTRDPHDFLCRMHGGSAEPRDPHALPLQLAAWLDIAWTDLPLETRARRRQAVEGS